MVIPAAEACGVPIGGVGVDVDISPRGPDFTETSLEGSRGCAKMFKLNGYFPI